MEKKCAAAWRCPPGATGVPPQWGVYVTVDGVDRRAEKAPALGCKILVAPTDIPEVGRFCAIEDPQGAGISLITYKPMRRRREDAGEPLPRVRQHPVRPAALGEN